VNLVGEHTDYNDGLVLPATIPLRTDVELDRRGDDLVVVRSAGHGEHRYRLGDERRRGGWGDHVEGVTSVLRETARRVSGFEARITSDIPAGAGLGSSAALAVALLRVVREAFALELDDLSLARLAHRAESELVGAPVGLMDQLSSSLGRDGEALFIDLDGLAMERVRLPTTLGLVAIDSGIAHENSTGAYAARRRECEEARDRLGLRSLRDATVEDVARLEREHPVLARRARHVVSENARVREALPAIRAADLVALGDLVSCSHRSLRDDFEVSTAQVDALVRLLEARPGVHGARIIGGGFGGAVLAIADQDAAAEAARVACVAYVAETGQPGRVLLPAQHQQMSDEGLGPEEQINQP